MFLTPETKVSQDRPIGAYVFTVIGFTMVTVIAFYSGPDEVYPAQLTLFIIYLAFLCVIRNTTTYSNTISFSSVITSL